MNTRQVAIAALAAVALVTAGAAAAAPRVTDPFREEHAGIRVHLGHIHQMTGELRTQPAAEVPGGMRFVVKFLNEHIRAHAEWEEEVLYPVVDRLAKSGKHPFTATMRHEHRIVGRWIDELAAESAKDAPGVDAFARRADYLLGLITAHFEEEEEVLLPLLDAGMTQAEFKREVQDRMKAH